MKLRVTALSARPLRVPLIEPFVIASGTMHETRALEISLMLASESGETAIGIGEAATLAPVTVESDAAIVDRLPRAATIFDERTFGGLREASAILDVAASGMPVFRAGLEAALADAVGKIAGVPVALLLDERASPAGIALRTDITLPITRDPEHAVRLATEYAARGFDCFKVKVGRHREADVRALRAVLDAVPGGRVRLDANAGYSAADALALLDALKDARDRIDCFEQPCGKRDLAGMAEVTANAGLPIVADESMATDADLDTILGARAASAINLKLVKQGGLLDAYRIGMRARAEGLQLMAGAMVETRLGLVSMAHVVWALGGVDWVDLDTAFLLAEDPYEGGWTARGPDLSIGREPGLGVEGEKEGRVMRKALTSEEIQSALSTLPGWRHEGDALQKTFELASFREAMSFLVRVGFEAEQREHHPEIKNVYGKVELLLRTHDAGNQVTKMDVELAKAIEAFAWT